MPKRQQTPLHGTRLVRMRHASKSHPRGGRDALKLENAFAGHLEVRVKLATHGLYLSYLAAATLCQICFRRGTFPRGSVAGGSSDESRQDFPYCYPTSENIKIRRLYPNPSTNKAMQCNPHRLRKYNIGSPMSASALRHVVQLPSLKEFWLVVSRPSTHCRVFKPSTIRCRV